MISSESIKLFFLFFEQNFSYGILVFCFVFKSYWFFQNEIDFGFTIGIAFTLFLSERLILYIRVISLFAFVYQTLRFVLGFNNLMAKRVIRLLESDHVLRVCGNQHISDHRVHQHLLKIYRSARNRRDIHIDLNWLSTNVSKERVQRTEQKYLCLKSNFKWY